MPNTHKKRESFDLLEFHILLVAKFLLSIPSLNDVCTLVKVDIALSMAVLCIVYPRQRIVYNKLTWEMKYFKIDVGNNEEKNDFY